LGLTPPKSVSSLNLKEGDSPREEDSLTHNWQKMLSIQKKATSYM